MPDVKIDQDHLWLQRKIEELKEEVEYLDAQLAELEQENLRSSVLIRKLGAHFGFGAAGKIDWARFKLNFKEKELDRYIAQYEMLKVVTKNFEPVPEPRSAPPDSNATETAQQKMDRMIAENPQSLEPHIRRLFQSLMEEEKLRLGW
jgi:hypothetical protein